MVQDIGFAGSAPSSMGAPASVQQGATQAAAASAAGTPTGAGQAAQAAGSNGTSGKTEEKKPENVEINSEKGYDALVKEMQRYLLFVLPGIVTAGKADLTPLKSKKTTSATTRLRRVDVDDISANTNLTAALARTVNIKHMRKIPPNVLAGLSPMIQVFKVSYPNGMTSKDSQHFVYRVPFDDGITAKGIPERTIETEILQPRMGGLDIASLVSFDYQYIGTNPAETETSITANMKLKFATIDALLGTRYLTSTDPNAPKKPINFAYSDLVNSSKRESEFYYRLKVKVGYHKVSETYIASLLASADNVFLSTGPKAFSEYVRDLTNAINDSNVLMYLYPVSHELNFSEAGPIDLSISFHGAVESSMVSQGSNVLLQSTEGKKVYDKIVELKKEKDKAVAKKEKEATGGGQNETFQKERDQIINDWDKKIQESMKDITVLYESFLDTLYSSGKVRCVKYDKALLGITTTGGVDSISADGNSRAEKLLEVSAPSLEYMTYEEGALNEKAAAMKKVVKAAGEANSASGDAASKEGKTPTESVDMPREVPDKINFIFLQDLILLAMGCFDDPQLVMDDLYLIIGNIAIPTAKKAYGNEISTANSSNVMHTLTGLDPTDSTYASKISILQFNIGTLPVSLEYFNKWFLETVVKPGKYEWKFKSFLYDLMELIRIACTNIFGTKLYGVPGSRTLLAATTVGKEFGKELASGGTNPDVTFSGKKFLGKVSIENEKEVSNVLYLFVPTLLTNQVNPIDVKTNDDLNVFTFTVGANVGLMKKVSYKKMDIPGVREARMTTDGDNAAGVLRMKYDADIEMYGPCYFRPGDIVVINPTFLSRTGTAENVTVLANDLGLGGVFMVLKTDTQVSRDGITTKLNTVYQSYGTLKVKAATSK